MSPASALAALAEAARHHPDRPLRETRRGLEVGGLQQAVFRLRRWPQDGPLADRLLILPCSAVTVALTATGGEDTCRAELTIRLAAPTPITLDQATAALDRLVTALGAEVTRLDGSQSTPSPPRSPSAAARRPTPPRWPASSPAATTSRSTAPPPRRSPPPTSRRSSPRPAATA